MMTAAPTRALRAMYRLPNPTRNIYEGYARVVDGDTLELDGQLIHLRGIVSFEIDQQCTLGKSD